EAEKSRALLDVEPIGTAQPRRVIEEVVEHLRERERHHDEVDAGRAQAQPADHQRRRRRAGETDRQRRERIHEAGRVTEPGEQIRGEPEERCVGEADQTRVTDEQIEAHREDAADHRLAHELQPEAIARKSHREQREGPGNEQDARDHPASPRGRRSRTAAITAYTTALEKPGSSTLPNVSESPTSRAPRKAPLIEPMPPITTTTNERTSTPSPMPGYTVVSGAASIPASAASAVLALNNTEKSLRTSMPRASTISAFDAPARTRMPKRVRRITCRIAAATRIQATAVKTRYAGHSCAEPRGIRNASTVGVSTPCTSLPN